MKFGKHLKAHINAAWRFHFMDYDSLKKFLKANKPPAWGPNHEECFIKMLDEELGKVSAFEALKYKELERHIAALEKEIHELNSTSEKDLEVSESKKKMAICEELDLITQDIASLSDFNSLNYTGFLKILKKHDKETVFNLKHTFMVTLASQPFYKETFDVIIIKLSSLYEKLKKDAPVTGSVSGTSFIRKTTKYWVHADNVMEVKCRILKHLPVLVFGRDDRSKYDSCITSIYFDNDQMDLYHERIEKVEKALAVRFRWYGETPREIFIERKTHHEDWTGETSVKERFPMKEKNVNAYCKGTFTLEKTAEKWKERKSDSEVNSMLDLSQEIQSQIINRNLKPVMRSFYNRTAFQLPNTAEVRISLDTELTLVNEAGKTKGEWYRKDVGVKWPFSHIDNNDVNRFPYAILEVKLQTAAGEEPPEWIVDLINSHLVEPVPKFSKFIHGCATLLESQVRLLPFWLPQMEKDIRRKPIEEEKTNFYDTDLQPISSKNYQPPVSVNSYQNYSDNNNDVHVDIGKGGYGATSSSFGTNNEINNYEDEVSIDESSSLLRNRRKKNMTILQHLASGGTYIRDKLSLNQQQQQQQQQSKPIAIPVRVEPKVFFANERTFLNWLHTSVLISTIGLALLNLGTGGKNPHNVANQSSISSIIAGLTLIPVSILFLVYAISIYFWRDHMIRTRNPGPYNTVGGPIFITIIFICALLINYISWFVIHGAQPEKW